MPQTDYPAVSNKIDMRIAIKVQKILDNETNAAVRDHLAIQTGHIDFCDVLHQDIYQKILQPHNSGLTSNSVIAFFKGYFDSNKRRELQIYHARLNHVIKILHEELFRIQEEPHYNLQLKGINACLMKYLCHMANQLPWHKEACELFVHKSKSNTQVININEDGRVQLFSYKALYLAARNQADDLSLQLAITQAEREEALEKNKALELELERAGLRPRTRANPLPSSHTPNSPRFLKQAPEEKQMAEGAFNFKTKT